MESKNKLWKLRYWIIAGYSIPVAALIVSAGVTTSQVQRLRHYAEELQARNQINDNISNVDTNVQIMARATQSTLLSPNSNAAMEYQTAQATYEELMAELEKTVTVEEQQVNLKLLREKVEILQQLNRDLIEQARQGNAEGAIATWRQSNVYEQDQAISEVLQAMETLEYEVLDSDKALQTAAMESLEKVVVTAAVASILLSVLIGTWIIYRTASQINGSATNIASSTAEIAASIEQQERIANQQASSVNETTTTIDELGASSRQSAEQAEAAASGAQQALNLAEGGARAVDKTLQGMDLLREKVSAIADQILRLSEQTSQIGSISGLVSDLANQTNMLALNAAVEAVRAGEHGKGFAVVSGEIRKLADQSKKSAEKINALVSDIQNAINSTVMVTDEGTKTVETSVAIATETAEAFAGVTDAMNNVVLNSQQISLNVQQQAVAIQQVVSAMNSLNDAAQETASGISQIKIGTQRLNAAADDLKVLV